MKTKTHHSSMDSGDESNSGSSSSFDERASIAPSTESDDDRSESNVGMHSARSSSSSSARRSPSPQRSPSPARAPDLSSNPLSPHAPEEPGGAGEWHDGTLETEPSDSYSFLSDPYAAAYHCMSAEEEESYFNSEEYRTYDSMLTADGCLVLREGDLTVDRRWKCLGFFLTKSPRVQSLRFHGVDLRVADFQLLKQVMFAAALAKTIRPRKRNQNGSMHTPETGSTPISSAWTGGWGVDVDSLERERRRMELSRNHQLRHITFSDNNIGLQNQPPSKAGSGSASASATAQPANVRSQSGSAQDKDSSARPTALQTTISLLLFCELLESVNLWRNNLTDSHAQELGEELIKKHPSLKSLSLRWNGITGTGAEQLGGILRKMSCDLSHEQQQSAKGSSNLDPPAATAAAVVSPAPAHASSHHAGGAKFVDLDLRNNRIDAAAQEKLRATMPPSTVFAITPVAPPASAAATATPARSSSWLASLATARPPSAAASHSPRRPPFFLNLQHQLAVPHCWRQNQSAVSTALAQSHFGARAFMSTGPRMLRPTA